MKRSLLRQILPMLAAVAMTSPGAARAAPGPSSPAGAESPAEQAKRLRKEGKALLDEGKPAQALPLLEEAARIEPGMLSDFRLGECYEKLGRTGSAYSLFQKVVDAARAERSHEPDDSKAATFREREDAAKQRAAALEPSLAKLTLSVPASVNALEGLRITLDGAPLERLAWETGIPVDPGKRSLEVSAKDRQPWRATIEVEAKRSDLKRAVPALMPLGASASTTPGQVGPVEEQKPASGWSTQRKLALSLGGVGVVGVIVGSVAGGLALSASKTFDEGRAAGCTGTSPLHCSSSLAATYRSADSLATVSNVMFAVGGAALVGGVVLWVTAPSGKAKPTGVSIGPRVGARTASVMLQGEW